MVARHLITTADQDTWSLDHSVLFLGDWCKILSEKSSWNNLDSITMLYHWDNRDQLHSDYKYLETLYENILRDFTDSLNSIHHVNHSIDYWRILIGPWLYYFIQTVFDRWQMISTASDNHNISETNVYDLNHNLILPNDFLDFEKQYTEDLWNHWIYGEIINDLGSIRINNIPYQKKIKLFKHKLSLLQKAKGYVYNLIKLVFEQLQRLSKRNKIFIFQSLFTSLQLARLEIKLGQFPLKYQIRKIKQFLRDQSLRVLINFEYEPKDKFERFLLNLIPKQIPKVYLEGYKDLIESVEKVHWPKEPEVIVTTAIIADDFFKCWVAEKKSNGSKLIVAQHGGMYGISKWSSNESHELLVSDLFLSWGWKGKNIIPIASSKISASKSKLKTNPTGGLLLTQATLPRYSYWMYSVPVASQLKHYLSDQIVFAESLSEELRSELTVKLYPKDYGWSQEERWTSVFPDITLAAIDSNYIDLIRQSRLNICTYNATTYLESLGANIPTIIFWDESFWELRQSAIEDIQNLRSAGILFNSPQEAASKVIEVWDCVDSWWMSNEVQDARIKFCNKYARTSSDWKKQWHNTLLDSISSSD